MSDIALRYLYETVMAGSMRAAGDRLGVAASSISRQVAQLELEYGMPLFERGRRTIQLTQAGELAIEHYRSLMASRESLSMRMEELREARTGMVSLGVGEGFLGPFFNQLIDRFHREHPQVQVLSTVTSSTAIVRSVLADEAHFGLVLYTPAEPNIRVRISVNEPLRVMVAPTHPLAGMARVSLADLVQHPICLGPEDFLIRQLLRTAEARQRLFLEPAIVINSIQAMRDLAATGSVTTVLHEFSARPEISDGRLLAIPLDETIDTVTVSLITRIGRQLESAPRRLLTAFESGMARWAATASR